MGLKSKGTGFNLLVVERNCLAFLLPHVEQKMLISKLMPCIRGGPQSGGHGITEKLFINIRAHKILTRATMWMNVQNNMLSERS